jgi:hypothetical protein
MNNNYNHLRIDHNGKLLDLALIQYHFTRNDHVIIKSAHGNSKGKSPYKKTKPSTLTRMKELCKDQGPVETMEILDSEVGDILPVFVTWV